MPNNKELKHFGKKLRAWQTDAILTKVVTLLNRSQPQNETTDNTERILPASVDQNPHRHLQRQSTWSNANLAWNRQLDEDCQQRGPKQ
jgi:hypothetical protein